MTVTPTLLPVITNCFSTEILPSFFPEIINRIVDCYSLRCVFCYSVHSFGYPLFNFSLLSLRNELVAVFLFAAVTHVERALVDDYFVPVFYSEKPAVPVGRFVPVFDDDAYVIDFPYFINTPPEYFSLLL